MIKTRSFSSWLQTGLKPSSIPGMTPTKPILISGAGPSGLVLALALRKNGLNVRIIDRESGPRLGERGAGVSARSLELHKILGTFPEIMAAAGSIPGLREHDPDDPFKVVRTFSLMPFNETNPNAPWRNYVAIGQNHHERILREHMEKAGAPFEFGTELRSFTQSEDNVMAEIVKRDSGGQETIEKVDFAWLIGADGARSTVRKALGVSFLGETRDERETVIADVRLSSPRSEFWDIWKSQEMKTVMLRPSSQDPDVVSILFLGKVEGDKLVQNSAALIDELHAIIGRQDIQFGEVIWSSKYRPNIRMVDTLRVGRVFLTGDAAHCHSPAGGQGLNSSIQDSFNLGWKLALVHKSIANASLLDTYDEERLPIIAQMLNKTTELLKHNLGSAPQSTEAEIRKDMNQLGVNYRGSSLIYYEPSDGDAAYVKGIGYNRSSETDALPGDRAPDAPGLLRLDEQDNTTSLFDTFSPSCHTVLVFTDNNTTTTTLELISKALHSQPAGTAQGVLLVSRQGQNAVVSSSSNFHFTLVDGEGHAFEGYRVQVRHEDPLVVIVRPDGVIGARFRGSEGVARYFDGILRRSLVHSE